MAFIGEQLRAARQARGLDVYQIADITKIRTDHIRALEEGNYEPFSAPVYIRGFVRSYAAAVKLDVARVMAELDEELSQTSQFRRPPSLLPRKRGVLDFVMLKVAQLNWQLWAIVIGVIVFVGGGLWGYGTWRRYKTQDPLANLGPGIYEAPRTNSGEFLPLPTNSPPRGKAQ
jgi:cytoskeletal protein RodZ